MKKLAVGIDIGGTNTVYGLVDCEGNMYGESSFPTGNYPNFNHYIKTLKDSIEELISALDYPIELVGIGVGAPNANYYSGNIELAPNLPWKGIVPFAKDLEAQFDNVPVVLTNDANAAAVGEMVYGGAKGMKNFIVVTLGTGVGSGFVCSSEVLYGHDGFAGELGHVTAVKNGRACGCGKRGCLETYASATGLKRTVYKYLAKENMPSTLRSISYDDLTSAKVYEAAIAGDMIAKKVFKYTGEVLGYSLANAIQITSPEAIFLFGGLTKAGDLIFEPARKTMEENLIPIFKGKVKLLPSAITGANSALLGASALIWKDYL
ncbi:MAG: ROK family protein [Rikenellaceae bacterium]